jgi:hypothetical protein
MKPVFEINGHDYAPYLKQKTGLGWQRDNTNDEDAGRDMSATMHPMVTSHQRTLSIKMGNMPFSVAQQLEKDLEDGDEGVKVKYPDIKDGVCTRLFYNTSISSAIEQFTDDDIVVDNISFNLTTIKEAKA